MNVLYFNQTLEISGAERSLLELLEALPSGINPLLATPPGELERLGRGLGVPTAEVPATDLSFRLHPVHTSRGIGWIAQAGWRLRSLAKRAGSQVVHANSARAGLAAVAAARLGGPPAVVHLRDWVPEGRVGRATMRTLERGAAAIIANSAYVARQLPGGSGTCPVHVIHNALDASAFEPGSPERGEARGRLGLPADAEVLLMIGHFVPWKGQADAVEVLARLTRSRPGVLLVLVGSAKFTASGTRYDSAAYEASVRDRAVSLGLEHEVRFLGERSDVPQVLPAADVLLVPSWQEAFGRAVLEGMAMALPVVATSRGGPAEILRDGIDGVLLPPREHERWAQEIGRLLADPGLRLRMGASGRARVLRDFTPAQHARRVAAVYEAVVGR